MNMQDATMMQLHPQDEMTNEAPLPLPENKEKVSIDVTDLLEEVEHNGSAILLRRPDRISLSYRAPLNGDGCAVLSELKFSATPSGAIVINNDVQEPQNDTPNSIGVNACALLQGSQQSLTHFDLGDVVEYAGGVDKRDNNIKAAYILEDQETEDVAKELDTIRHFCSNGLGATVCVSTRKSSKEPIRLCQATVLFPKKLGEVEEQGDQKEKLNSNLDIGILFVQQDNRLKIKSIQNDGWFGSPGCALKEGHLVVGINEFIASSFSVEDANCILQDILSSGSQLSITSIATTPPTTQKWDKMRKGLVAAGGGTLVASGAVLMVTPLHPVGHAMALGGVGVLGMEFEAPRKAMSSAKERWSEKRKSWSERRTSWSERRRNSRLQREESSNAGA